MPTTDQIREQIESRLATAEPDVEVLLAEKIGAERLRVTIDHPDGVDLELCERVTNHLRDLLQDYGLEVSSPGPDRPLSKPTHFQRFRGCRVQVRTKRPLDGSRNFTGELVEADDQAVTVAADNGLVSIPYADMHKSNLLQN